MVDLSSLILSSFIFWGWWQAGRFSNSPFFLYLWEQKMFPCNCSSFLWLFSTKQLRPHLKKSSLVKVLSLHEFSWLQVEALAPAQLLVDGLNPTEETAEHRSSARDPPNYPTLLSNCSLISEQNSRSSQPDIRSSSVSSVQVLRSPGPAGFTGFSGPPSSSARHHQSVSDLLMWVRWAGAGKHLEQDSECYVTGLSLFLLAVQCSKILEWWPRVFNFLF